MGEDRMSRKPQILMIAPSCYPPGNPEAFVNANLVSAMLSAGWHVDVVTGTDRATHWYPQSQSGWRDVAAHAHIVQERPRAFSWKLLSIGQYGILSGQIMGGGRWAIPAARSALQLIRARTYDVIISRSLPAAAHVAAFLVAGKTGLPWIANWNDPVPDYYFPPPAPRRGRPMGLWEKRYYRAMIHRASWHTFPCVRLRSYICGYMPAGLASRSSVIPHMAADPIRTRNTPDKKKFSLLYAGSLRAPRDPRPFLSGVRRFIDKIGARDIVVRFMTDRPEDVRSAVREQALEEIVSIETGRPYDQMPEVLAEAQVLVIVEANMKEGIFLPSKFVDYVCAGRPILAVSPARGTLSDILSRHGGGLAVDCGRPEEIASALETFYGSWNNGILDKKYSSSRLMPLFDEKAVLTKYLDIFKRLGIRGAWS